MSDVKKGRQALLFFILRLNFFLSPVSVMASLPDETLREIKRHIPADKPALPPDDQPFLFSLPDTLSDPPA